MTDDIKARLLTEAAPKAPDEAPRFFIDHGVIHDRVTGKHIPTGAIEYEEGKWDNSPTTETCALLNDLNTRALEASVEDSEENVERVAEIIAWNYAGGTPHKQTARAILTAIREKHK